jgi:hypothetical protein
MTALHPSYDEPPYDPYDDQPNPTPTTPERAAEQAVLGAMLLDPATAIPAVTRILRGPDYAHPDHELLHDTLTQLHTAGTPIDPVTVVEHLATRPSTTMRGRSLLEQLGGAPWLHTLMQACPVTASADHYAEIVRTAARRRTIEDTGLRLTQIARTGPADALDTALDQAYKTIDEAAGDFGPSTQTPTTWAPVNLTPVLAGEYLDPPPTMLRRTDGTALFYAGGVHTVSGESESGKTWLCLLAALQELDKHEHVTFVDFEDRADRVIARLLALGARPDQIRDQFAYIRPDRPLDDTGRGQLEPAIHGRTLVIVDGVTEAMTLHGYDLNGNQDSALFQALLPRWIADRGPAVAMIDHVVKDKEKQDRHAIGAQHKLAGIDGAAYMVKTIQPFARGKRGIAQILIAKDRPGYVREQAFGKVIGEFALDGSINDVTVIAELNPPGRISGRSDDGRPFEPTHVMERVSAYVATNPGLSKKAIEDAQNGRAATTRLALELLVTRGYIGTKAGLRGAVQHYSHKPYFESDHTSEPAPHTTGDTHPEDDE